jgi:hypothetical protein
VPKLTIVTESPMYLEERASTAELIPRKAEGRAPNLLVERPGELNGVGRQRTREQASVEANGLVLRRRPHLTMAPAGPVALRVGMIEAGLSSEVINPLSPLAASEVGSNSSAAGTFGRDRRQHHAGVNGWRPRRRTPHDLATASASPPIVVVRRPGPGLHSRLRRRSCRGAPPIAVTRTAANLLHNHVQLRTTRLGIEHATVDYASPPDSTPKLSCTSSPAPRSPTWGTTTNAVPSPRLTASTVHPAGSGSVESRMPTARGAADGTAVRRRMALTF